MLDDALLDDAREAGSPRRAVAAALGAAIVGAVVVPLTTPGLGWPRRPQSREATHDAVRRLGPVCAAQRDGSGHAGVPRVGREPAPISCVRSARTVMVICCVRSARAVVSRVRSTASVTGQATPRSVGAGGQLIDTARLFRGMTRSLSRSLTPCPLGHSRAHLTRRLPAWLRSSAQPPPARLAR